MQGLDAQNLPSGQHHSLADIQRRQGGENLQPFGAIAFVLCAGVRADLFAGLHQQRRHHRMGGFEDKALFLEHSRHLAQQRIIALPHRRQQPWGQAGHLRVKLGRVQGRALHGSGKDQISDAGGFEPVKQGTDLLKRGGEMRLPRRHGDRHAGKADKQRLGAMRGQNLR